MGEAEGARLGELCKLARDEFEPFLKTRRLRVRHHRAFRFDVAMLPDTAAYRGINDVQWRFIDRPIRDPVTGYASLRDRYLFMIAEQTSPDFAVTLLHEQYHAMSYYYGVYQSLPGPLAERRAAEERNARAFTRRLGYGE